MRLQPNLAAKAGAWVDFPEPGGPTRMTMEEDSDGMTQHSEAGADFVWWYLPYCLERLADGSYVPLNRSYKPVGLVTGNRVDYELAPIRGRLLLTTEQLREIDHTGNPDGDGTAFLYDDGSFPSRSPENWDAYLDRLSVLAGFARGS